MKLFHIYSTGRFGPEKHFGFVIAENANCIQETTYVTFDIAKSTEISKMFWTNPLAIGSLKNYRKWQRGQLSK